MSTSPSRRRLLQAGLLAPLAACTSSPSPPSPRPRPALVDPDVALRAAAVAREQQLIARYAGTSSPAALAIRAEHEQHLLALGGPVASPVASPIPAAAASVPQLVAAERAAAAAHAADALRASRGLAALLASLAASEASHPVALA